MELMRLALPLLALCITVAGCDRAPNGRAPVSDAGRPVLQDTAADTSLWDAIRSGNEQRVASYLENGASPDETKATDPLHGDVRNSLLSMAIYSEQFEMASFLLRRGASPNGAKGESDFPLWWAARGGNLKITKELVSRGANLDTQREGNGTTALHVAIYFDHPAIVKFLVDSGADVTKRTLDLNPWDIHGATPLQLAQALGRKECEQELTPR